MPRKPRIILPHHPVHIIQRGNNRSATFYTEDNYRFYLDALSKASRRYGCAVHAYVLMTNHVHLLLSATTEAGISAFMQSVGRRYVRYLNNTYNRTGTLWEGRFKSSLIQDDHYYLTCSRYIELNPVRAAMVNHPGDYLWSSYHYHGLGETDTIIQPHPLYLELGKTMKERARRYRDLFETHIDSTMLDQIRTVANKEQVLGDDRFKEETGLKLQRKIENYSHGGDRKSKTFKREQTNHAQS